MFKKTLLAAMVLATAGSAIAETTSNDVAGGNITFYGSVTDTTCNVTTNSGADFTVTLDPITTTQAGESVGVVADNAKPFTMKVSGCKQNVTKADKTLRITFGSADISDDEKYMKNNTGTSEGVGITITKDKSAIIDFNTAIDTAVTGVDETELTYYANYYNYGGKTITSGNIITAAQYTFSYE